MLIKKFIFRTELKEFLQSVREESNDSKHHLPSNKIFSKTELLKFELKNPKGILLLCYILYIIIIQLNKEIFSLRSNEYKCRIETTCSMV